MPTRTGTYPSTAVPTPLELRVLTRFGTGYTPADLSRMRAAGGAGAWFEQQLRPATITEPARIKDIDAWYADRRVAPGEKYRQNLSRKRLTWEWTRIHGNWSLLQRTYSRRAVLETMTEFWSNHFHVTAHHPAAWPSRYELDRTIRAHALGTFDDLLVAVSLHPAMLLYLDTFLSTADRPSENQGRELLELHTVGLGSGYTEEMVKASSALLSGWTVDFGRTFTASYQPHRHRTGPVSVLDFSDPNADADGRALCERYLRHLAHHPATVRRLADKLVRRFVSADPSDALVSRIAEVLSSSGLDVKTTLRALVEAPELVQSAPLVRTGTEDAIATVRALGVVATGRRPSSLADTYPLLAGEYPFTWPFPNGYPTDQASLVAPGRMLRSTETHWQLARALGQIRTDTSFRPTTSWLPKASIRFDAWVDHLCRSLLGRVSTPALLDACVAATGVTPSTPITKKHPVATWRFVCVATALLDSTEHMTR